MRNVISHSLVVWYRRVGAAGAQLRTRRGLPALGLGLAVLGLAVALHWAYWPTFCRMVERWSTNPQYSHGFLVPVFALVILWAHRDRFPHAPLRPSWWGAVLLGLAGVLRFASAYVYFEPLDGLTLLPALVGICLLLAGPQALRWCWPAIAFLGFMLPLPYQLEMALAQPLRRMATAASTYALQTLGYAAFAEGNVILIDDMRLGVIDACSGLGMLFTFFALATAVALVIQRPLLDRAVVVLSAVPIALIVNIARITLTSVAHVELGPEAGQLLMHDLAGWLMMPMALGLVWLELWSLKRLLPPVGPATPVPLRFPSGGLPSPYPLQAPRPGAGLPVTPSTTRQ